MKRTNSTLSIASNAFLLIAFTFCTATASAQNEPFWSNLGNSNVQSTDFLGSTNAQPLVFKTHGFERVRFDVSGNVGIGTSAPTAKLEVYGNTKLTGSVEISNALTIKNAINFGSDYGIKYITGSSTTPEYLSFGRILTVGSEPENPPAMPFCFGGNIATVNAFSGLIQSYGYAINGGQANTMTMGFDGVNGIIETIGDNDDGISPRLLVNYNCGRDVLLCTGTSGGFVTIGRNLEIGNVNRDQNTTLKIDGGATNAFVVTKGNNTPFLIRSDGATTISIDDPSGTPNALQIIDNSTQQSNFLVKSNGYLYARRIEITMNAFPDYVFSEHYQLLPFHKLKEYISVNKHLPNMPTASCIEKNGADIGELTRLNVEKIEELHLYIMNLNDRIEKLEAENAALKRKSDK